MRYPAPAHLHSPPRAICNAPSFTEGRSARGDGIHGDADSGHAAESGVRETLMAEQLWLARLLLTPQPTTPLTVLANPRVAHRMVDLRAAGDPGQSVRQQRVFGDLISYQNAGNGCAAVADQVQRTRE